MYLKLLILCVSYGITPSVFSKGLFLFRSSALASQCFNSLPNDSSLDQSKFKAFADDKIILTQKSKFVLGSVENIAGKGENSGYQHFLLFPQCFQKLCLSEVLKVEIV